MGQKASNFSQMDRPESGGADRDNQRENSGLLNTAKGQVSRSQKEKHRAGPGVSGAENAASNNDVDPATRRKPHA
jgi:hypothetical protein